MQERQWEYLVLNSRGTAPCVFTLNAKGLEGWEAVGCYALKFEADVSYCYEWCVLLKRPKAS